MATVPEAVLQRAARVRLLAMDVDGVLTDGSLYYGNQGEELKAFSILDGLGIKLLAAAGVRTAIITGRRSELVARRAAELRIDQVIQGREDKLAALRELCAEQELNLDQAAYIGDDLPDLAAICSAGLGIAVANAPEFVRHHAHWRTSTPGGRGAVRETCELLLRARGQLQATLERYLPPT